MSTSSKIVIIGAGPAGIGTALFLAKMGIRSTVIDKDVKGRDKVCGDNVTSVALRHLKELGIDPDKDLNLAPNSITPRGIKCFAPNGRSLDLEFLDLEKGNPSPSIYLCRRTEFDQALADVAAENPLIDIKFQAEVTTIDKSSVQLKSGQRIDADLIVLATGSSGKFSQILDPEPDQRHMASGIRGYFKSTALDPEWCQLYIDKDTFPGAMYVTPLPHDVVNINLVVREDLRSISQTNLRELFFQKIQQYQGIPNEISKDSLIGNLQGHPLKLGTRKRKVVAENLIVVGDAAGLIDILSANGIPQALVSAKVAAKNIAKAVEANDYSVAQLSSYAAELTQATAPYLKTGKQFQRVMTKKWFRAWMCFAMNLTTRFLKDHSVIRDLWYDSDSTQTLKTGRFYWRLLGIKSSDTVRPTSLDQAKATEATTS